MTPSRARADWFVLVSLTVLSAVPVIAGAVRLGALTGGAQVTPENARFFDDPVPVVLHIVSASVYCLLGAVQFAPGLRRRRIGWHRASGRLLVPLGITAAVSGMWMTVFYDLPEIDDNLLLGGQRLVFGTAMALSLVLAVVAVRRGDIARHRAWMIRGYAIGQGAGTQVLTHLPWMLVLGVPGELTRALLMGAGWVVNLAVAEWIIRRGPRGKTAWPRTAPVVGSGHGARRRLP
ncbi:DUF2306 domain-containing protein [Nocardiopsis sp. NPDC050513]|uniref:DUF2306 domain-containing protein n=1 Tax=Nocardiopsis sp. NPDC050513 TaxID=3364338 RepID=UPI0037A981DA